MAMVKSRRWLLAAAVFLLVLAACTSTSGRPGPGTVSLVDYNHYSLLRTIEDIFGLPHLGDAAMPQVRSFGPDVWASRPQPDPVPARGACRGQPAGTGGSGWPA